jgi:hypothetical protein
MASVSEDRPEILGFKLDECTSCHRVDVHLLAERIERQKTFTRTTSHRLVCTRCGASVTIDSQRARSAVNEGSLDVERERPGTRDVLASGPRPAPSDRLPVSPYVGGDPDMYVPQRLAHARLALARGASPATVERDLLGEFVPNPNAKPVGRYRTLPITVATAVASVVLAAVLALALWSGEGGPPSVAGGDTAGVVATPRPTPRPDATPVPAPSLLPEDLLAGYVPPAVSAGCERRTGETPELAIAGLRCDIAEFPGTTVDYYLFGSKGDLYRGFFAERDAANIRVEGDACFKGGTREVSVYYYEDPRPVGEVTCFKREDRPEVLWTHWADQVMVRAYRDRGPVSDVWKWWLSGAPGPCDGPCQPRQ